MHGLLSGRRSFKGCCLMQVWSGNTVQIIGKAR